MALRFATAVPDTTLLGLAAPLVFVGLLTTAVRDRAGLTAAVAGAVGALLAVPLPGHLAILAGVLVGTGAGSLTTRNTRRRT